MLVLAFSACHETAPIESKYPRMIGDIAYDPSIDTTEHKLCNSEKFAVQYYVYNHLEGNYPFKEEKHKVNEIFRNKYNPQNAKKESGLIRIRFLVNCKGEAGRYRVISMDENYQEKTFDPSITDQLLSITMNDLEWAPFETEGKKRDYYMYLIFKIREGEIIEILP